jgi:hypothetical protein
VPYRVTGEIVDIERKRGRTTGIFDILTFREHLLDPDGTEAAVVTSMLILPRRDVK